jgi:hypothetical protein
MAVAWTLSSWPPPSHPRPQSLCFCQPDFHDGLEQNLRAQLINAAPAEQLAHCSFLQAVELSYEPNSRCLLNNTSIFNKGACKAHPARQARSLCPWVSYVPNKVQIYGWLLCPDRPNTRVNLHHKIINSTSYPQCTSPIENTIPLFSPAPLQQLHVICPVYLAFRLLPIFFKTLHYRTSLLQ